MKLLHEIINISSLTAPVSCVSVLCSRATVFIAFSPIYPCFAFHQKRIIKKLVLLITFSLALFLSAPGTLHNCDNLTAYSVPQVLVLNDCGIDQAGEAEDLKKKCYTVKELDLAQNKLENWNEVEEFRACLPSDTDPIPAWLKLD